MNRLDEIRQALESGKDGRVAQLVQEALSEGTAPTVLLNEGLLLAMEKVGKRFQAHEIFLPHVLLAARAMKKGMELLRPGLVEAGHEARGIVAMGTVAGDIHDIGQNLVGMMLEGAGYEVRYLGHDCAPAAFVEAAQDGAQVLGLSALLTTTMPAMPETLAALEAAGLRAKVKVLVGGAPVDQAWADEIGADGYGSDAASTVDLVNGLFS